VAPTLEVLLAGDAAVYRGHDGAREAVQDPYAALAEIRFEFPEIRNLDDPLVAIGRTHVCGTDSGVEIESSWANLVEFRRGKAILSRGYLDPEKALKAAGLRV
jgi:ketosteroid isomerase-like protein